MVCLVLRVLIAGLLAHDSGKTWLGLSLVRKLIDRGLKVGVYKPVAGHSAWHQYQTVVESFRMGILVGEDILRYSRVVEGMDIAVSNPVDILLAPIDPTSYLGGDIYSYLADLDNQFKQMVLARISRCCGELSVQHFVFEENLSLTSPPLRQILKSLAEKLNATPKSVEDFIALLKSPTLTKQLEVCMSLTERGRDILIIESFNNAITPFGRALDLADILLVVAPGALAVYSSSMNRIRDALSRSVRDLGERGFETANIVSKVKPDAVVYTTPRASPEYVDESVEKILKFVLPKVGGAEGC